MQNRWRMNDGIAALLLAIVALAPLPLASNRPMFWMLSASGVFFTASVFFAVMALKNRHLPVPLRRIWPWLALGAAYLLFMVLQSAGMLGAVAPKASLLATVRLAGYATFFFLVLQVSTNTNRAAWMADIMLYSVVLYALIGFLAHFEIVRFPATLMPDTYPNSATATFVNRNSFATYLGFGLLTSIALLTRRLRALWSRQRGVRLGALAFADIRLAFILAATLLIFVTLLATNSRMGVGAVVFALSIYLLILVGKRKKPGMIATLLGVGLAVGGFYLGFRLYGGDLVSRLGAVENDAEVRFALYRQVWDMIMDRPWTGFGADSFEMAFQPFHRLPVSPDLVWDKAHNSYLANWAETGLVFGSIPLVFLATILAVLARAALKRRRNFVLPLLGLSVILQAGLHSLLDFSLEIQANVYLFLAIVAMALADALSAKSRKEKQHA